MVGGGKVLVMVSDLVSLVADMSPYVIAAVEADGRVVLATAATDEAADTTVQLGRRILQRVFRTHGQAEQPPQAIIDLAVEPHDPDLQAALRVEIRRAVAGDPQLAQDVRQMLADVPSVGVTASAERSIATPTASDVVASGDAATSGSVAKIFLSHAHEDYDVADQLTVALAHEGIEPWLDAQELHPGDELLATIAQTLAAVDYFALLLTRAALTKRWVLAETRMAVTREIEAGL